MHFSTQLPSVLAHPGIVFCFFGVAGPVFLATYLVPPGGVRKGASRRGAIGLLFLMGIVIGAFWLAGRQSPWVPDSHAVPLPQSVIRATTGPIYEGAQLFYRKGCINCHAIEGFGGNRGPDLTRAGSRLSADQLAGRIMTGGRHMPAYSGRLFTSELSDLVAFLQSRKSLTP